MSHSDKTKYEFYLQLPS